MYLEKYYSLLVHAKYTMESTRPMANSNSGHSLASAASVYAHPKTWNS